MYLCLRLLEILCRVLCLSQFAVYLNFNRRCAMLVLLLSTRLYLELAVGPVSQSSLVTLGNHTACRGLKYVSISHGTHQIRDYH
jgi:hypothetical protein